MDVVRKRGGPEDQEVRRVKGRQKGKKGWVTKMSGIQGREMRKGSPVSGLEKFRIGGGVWGQKNPTTGTKGC